MSAQSPNQFPTSGERKPSFDEMLQQAEAQAIANPISAACPSNVKAKFMSAFFSMARATTCTWTLMCRRPRNASTPML